LTARAFGDHESRMATFRGSVSDELALFELPQFVRPEPGPEPGGPDRPPHQGPRHDGPGFRGEVGWTIVELDLDYVSGYLLPELLQRHLGSREAQEYHVHLAARDQPSTVIYDSYPSHGPGAHFDASVGLFDPPFGQIFISGGGPGPMRRFGGPPPQNMARGRRTPSVPPRARGSPEFVGKTRPQKSGGPHADFPLTPPGVRRP